MKWLTFATVLLLVVLMSILAVQWEQLQAMRALVARETSTMTDPGPLELKTPYLTGYDGNGKPVFWTVTTTRNAPGETVTHWIDRHAQDLKDAMVVHPPYTP